MIEFLVKQCALDPNTGQPAPSGKNADPEFISNAALKTMCENVLQLMTTTIDGMENVLWPRLIEYVVPEAYGGAITAVAKCIAHLGSLKRERMKAKTEENTIVEKDVKSDEVEASNDGNVEKEQDDQSTSSPEPEEKKSESDDYFLNYELHADLPRPAALLSRSLVLLGHPQENNGRGLQLLAMLQSMSPNIHPSIVEMWDTVSTN